MSPVQQIEVGRVNGFYPNRGFGFIAVEGEEEAVFFHFDSGESIVLHRGQPTFEEPWTTDDELEIPKRGDHVVFIREQNAKGSVAKPWSYLAQWNRAVRQMNGGITEVNFARVV